MNDLILAENESLTMLSYDLLALINIEREKFNEKPVRLNQFNNRVIDELDGDDYKSFVVENPNKTTSNVYELTIDQCMLVAMRESKSVRKSVLTLLNKTQPQHQIPQTLSQALILAGEQAAKIERQQEQLSLAAPKVEFVDRFVQSTGNKTFREVAKMLKANEREFRAFLYGHEYMYQIGGGWTAYQRHVDAGRFYVTGGEANGHAYTTCKFTPKGIEYIAGKWLSYTNNLTGE